MGSNNYFAELIVSYLSGNLNAEEEAFVLDWINSSAENKRYFEELRNTWNVLSAQQIAKKIDIALEWHRFKQVTKTQQEELFAEENESVGSNIGKEVKQNNSAKVYKIFLATAAVAAILSVIVLAWKFTGNNANLEKQVAQNIGKEIPLQPEIHYERNATDKSKQLVLQDGSKIRLYGKSEVSYYEPFIGNKRDIRLTGKADFTVAKNAAKPFTVFSGDISTTALGTRFTVIAFARKKYILVGLHEGKVVVKSTKALQGNQMKDIFLVPGQELIYNIVKGTAKVESSAKKDKLLKKSSKKEELFNDEPEIPKYEKSSWFMFNNQPLYEVFDVLSNMYSVKILYSKKDIYKKYFIGTFYKTDLLDSILKQIASINNLVVVKDSNNYVIQKSSKRSVDNR